MIFGKAPWEEDCIDWVEFNKRTDPPFVIVKYLQDKANEGCFITELGVSVEFYNNLTSHLGSKANFKDEILTLIAPGGYVKVVPVDIQETFKILGHK